MKTIPLLILLALHYSPCFGNTPGEILEDLSKVRAERKATLQAIVAQAEQGFVNGTGSMSDLIEAKIDLHEYEREGESSFPGKIAPQQKILELEEKRHALMVQLMRSGKASSLDSLKSKERILAAKQLLLEFKVQAAVPAPSEKENENTSKSEPQN